MSAPGAARHLPPLLAFLSVFGFEKVEGPGAADEQGSALAAFAASETFRWLRRWAGVAVVAIVTPLTVLAAYGDEMPAFHRVAVPIAVAVIVPAWVLELSGVRWPKLALVAATVLPNVWLTLIGHVHTNYLWLLLLVPWVAFAGSLAEGVLALTTSTASIALAVAVGAPWSFWFTWTVGFLLAWFMGLVLRRQVVLVAELRLLRGETERRRVEIEALYRADEQIYRSLRLDEVLQALVDVASDLLRPDKVSVGMWDAETDRIVVGAARGFSSTTVAESVPPEEAHLLREHLSRGVVTIEDVQTDARLPASIAAANRREGIRSSLTAPIRIAAEVVGAFGLSYCQLRSFSQDEQRLLAALAQRAALAIQNARLYEQAQQAATLEERQRLARELHDAVTQTLFSASLIAEVLPQLWRSKPDQVPPRLEQLRQLSRGALAEMRTLLLELRPAALSEMPLNDLLRQLVEATMARVPVQLELRSEGSSRRLPADVQVGLYRLVQEALNNVAKHAQASQAEVHVRWTDQAVVLRIRDDGRGFEPAAIPAGHLGVGFMRERAAAIAASLDITSRLAAGTTVTICWPAPRGRLRAPHPRARLLSAPRS